MEEYVEVGTKQMRIAAAGLVGGFVASLWTILPFFVPGIFNLIALTLAAGVVAVIMIVPLNKNHLLKSGVIFIAVFLLVSFLIVPAASGFASSGEISDAEGEVLNLKVPGLFCQGCAYSTQSALKGIPGVIDARVDFATKSGVVVYDPNQISPEEIVNNNVVQAYGGYAE